MHVLLIHQALVSPNDAGDTRYYGLARYLLGRGHQFTIAGSDVNYFTEEADGQRGQR